MTLELSDDQHRALALLRLDWRQRRIAWIWLCVALGLFVIGGSLPRSIGRVDSIGWVILGSVLLAAVLTFAVYRSHRAASGSRVVTRAIGEMRIVTEYDNDGGSITYVDIRPGDRLVLHGEVPGPSTIGGVEYTTRGRLPIAVWDIEGSLVWHAADYRPTDTRPEVLARVKLETT